MPRAPLTSKLMGLALSGLTYGTFAQNAPDEVGVRSAVITHHTGVFDGKKVKYEAIVEPIVVNDTSGKPAARLVAVSYIANAAKGSHRPVLFVFNGGPIAASDALHMGALGPKRVAIPDDLDADPKTFRIVDNHYTVLDVADLVFFDPAGTGFSRTLNGVDPAGYFSVTADGQQLAQFVIEWCKTHERQDSPKYLFGESYGTMRAAATANQLQKITPSYPLAGIVLMGQALNIIEFSQRPANVTSYIVSLPTLAAIAWSHGKAQTGGKDFDRFMDEVQTYARTEYLTALFRGSSLDDATRDRVAARLETYTGIPKSFYLANALKITKERYRRELLKNRNEILGMVDARYVRPNDPDSHEDPAMAIYHAYHTSYLTYLRDLGVLDTHDYIPAAVPKNELDGWRWDGTGTSPFADWPYMKLLSEVFDANPQFRLMIGNGWQDTQTTVGAALLARDQSGWPQDRVSVHFYQGGHMAYSVESSLGGLTTDLRTFLQPSN
jgi:carboxypeptidase C (cathepsin A)